MNPLTTSVFNLPERLSFKASPELIAADEQHFAAMDECLRQTVAELTARRDDERRMPHRSGAEALERDQNIHRLSRELRTLGRYGLDLCLGHLVRTDGRRLYIGRLGLRDRAGNSLLVDWRSPAAEPFFAATHANPMGLTSRRRYRWQAGKIADYWDEVFTEAGLASNAALDDQSAFIASLGGARTERMRDVLGTIAADQDAIIRAGSRGALVVDGGPGTGKTVVALHRTAFLLYADPRLGHDRGGVLFVGPHQPYLNYVADVLPSLGEEGVRTCTLQDLIDEGPAVEPETDQRVAALKSTVQMVTAIEPAVRFYEEPPAGPQLIETPWAEVTLMPRDWARAFEAVEPGTPHNEAHGQILEELSTILTDKHQVDEPTAEQVRRWLLADRGLRAALAGVWPMLDPADLVGDLWSVPAYLRLAAPHLSATEVAALQRKDSPRRWTVADLPLLDAARRRLGDPALARREAGLQDQLAADRRQMDEIVSDLIAADDSEMQVMSMLRGDDARNALDDEDAYAGADPDRLAGPFAHIVVDEAQELTDAQWQMLLARCPSGSFTIVGDRAQARHGFVESWPERLERVGLNRITMTTLGINYRTPAEVMAEAAPAIRAALPDANVPESVRSTGIAVAHRPRTDLVQVLDEWCATHDDGIACVIAASPLSDNEFRPDGRISSLIPELAKGMEFDLVVLIDPDQFGDDGDVRGVSGAVDRYVAMTRATQQLVILTS